MTYERLISPMVPVGRRWRTAAVLATALVIAPAAGWVAGGSASAAPLTFALSPVINNTTGLPVCDGLDESPDYADIACNTSDHASSYFGSDGTTLGGAVVLEVNPITLSNQAPFQSTTYVVELGAGSPVTHKASFGIDAKGTNNTDYLYAGCAGAAAPTYKVLLSTALADGTVLVAPDGLFTRVTFNVPLSSLATCGITAVTPLAPYFGTSQAGPLANINKDFFLGKSVDFGPVTPDPTVVPAGASIATQSACVNNAVINPTYTLVASPHVTYNDGTNNVSGTVTSLPGATVVITATAENTYEFADHTTTKTLPSLVFDPAPANCPAAPLEAPAGATITSQSQCVNGAATNATYTLLTSPHVTYSNGTGAVSGLVTVAPGSVVDITATPATGYVLAPNVPSTYHLVFDPAPANCAPAPEVVPAGASITSESSCVDNAPTNPTYTLLASPHVVYSDGTKAVSGVVTAAPGGVVDITATPAAGYALAGASTFHLVFASAPANCPAAVAPPAEEPPAEEPPAEEPPAVEPTQGGTEGEVLTPPVAHVTPGTPVALPFTGTYTDRALRAGVCLLTVGLFLALAGRRRRTA